MLFLFCFGFGFLVERLVDLRSMTRDQTPHPLQWKMVFLQGSPTHMVFLGLYNKWLPLSSHRKKIR